MGRRPRAGLDRLTTALHGSIAPLFLFLTTVALGAADGGYYPTAWGFLAVGSAWLAILVLILGGSFALSRAELSFLVALALLCCWTALSLLWTGTTTQTALEIQRTAGYLAFAVAVALVLRRDQVATALASLLAAITVLCAYGLATRLFPDRVTAYDPSGSYRLSVPTGYWNALSLLAALGAILAAGCAARASRALYRALAAGAMPLVVATLYFTFGRGGWLALAVGLGSLLVLDRNRLELIARLLPLSIWPALAVWRAHEASALTTPGSAISAAASQGRTLGWTLLALSLAAFATSFLLDAGARRFRPSTHVRTAFAVVLIALAVGAVGGAVAAAGGPTDVARKARDSVHDRTPNVSGDQTSRLFSLSANYRLEHWSAAIAAAREHPLIGMGAGTYEQWWLQEREVAFKVRDAHSLPLETAAELGLVGLVLVLAVFVIPIGVGIRERGDPFVPVAVAGLVAYLAHASIDWDWEMPVLTVIALALATIVLLPSRRTILAAPRTAVRVLILALAAGAAVSVVTIHANRALAEGEAALARDDPATALRRAHTAARWAPWSSGPLQLKADLALEEGEFAAARRTYLDAIEKDPRNWELWFGLALASEGAQRREALNHARRLNPLSTSIEQLLTAAP